MGLAENSLDEASTIPKLGGVRGGGERHGDIDVLTRRAAEADAARKPFHVTTERFAAEGRSYNSRPTLCMTSKLTSPP